MFEVCLRGEGAAEMSTNVLLVSVLLTRASGGSGVEVRQNPSGE